MDQQKQLDGLDKRYRILGAMFSLSTKLETMGDGPYCLGELTTKQWFLLANLTTFFDQPPTLGELARQMGTSHQNSKAIAAQLQKKGFISLARDPKDGRAVRVIATEKCGQYAQGQNLENQAFVKEWMAVLTPEEVDRMDDYLVRLLRRAAEMHIKLNAQRREIK